MKNSTASNAVVSLAGALAETVQDYESQLRDARAAIEQLGQQLKQLNDERSKVVAVVSGIQSKMRTFAAGKLGDGAVLVEVNGLLRDFPWPIPNQATPSSG